MGIRGRAASGPGPALTATLKPVSTNAIGRMVGLLGDEWTLLLVRESLLGARRFSDFAERLPISNAVLTQRLQKLVDDGLLRREVYQERPLRAGYQPTRQCQELWPVLVSIWHWERAWVPEHPEKMPLMHHLTCGHDFSPVLRCAHCHQPVNQDHIDTEWGPSGGWLRSVPEGATRRRSGADKRGQAGLFPETMSILGNRWASAMVAAAFLGSRQFGDFQTRLSAPPAVIADRLRGFCTMGVLQRASHPKRSDWSEYHLTPKGLAFFPVVMTAVDWGQRHFPSTDGPAMVFTHRECGRPFTPELACDQCEQSVDSDAIEPR